MDKRTPKSWSLYFYWVPSFSYFVTGGDPLIPNGELKPTGETRG